MVTCGDPPYLECSSKGDRRFSPFFAYPSCLGGYSIEDAYHACKIFDDRSSGLSWREAKAKRRSGHVVVNQGECDALYSFLWDEYMAENPDLVAIIRGATGLSDMFGYGVGPCQARELWRIRNSDLFR